MTEQIVITYEQSKAFCTVREDPRDVTDAERAMGITKQATLNWVFKDEVQEWIDAASFPIIMDCGRRSVRLTFENEADRRLFCYYWQVEQ